MTRNFVIQRLKMGMHIRAHGREDSLMLARPKADERHVLATLLEWDLDFMVALHTGWSIGRRVDDVEIDQFRPPCYHERKSLGQLCLGTRLADEPFQFHIGPQFIRYFLGLPSGDFGPHEERHARLVALRHMDKVIATDAREGRPAVRNRHFACQPLDRTDTVEMRPALERPQVQMSGPIAGQDRLALGAQIR
jgi:hypothetical protein